MALPPCAPFPSAQVQDEMVAVEWEACLDAWITLTGLHLRLPSNRFSLISTKDESLITFLVSYMSQNHLILQKKPLSEDQRSKSLRRNCFLLVHRLFSELHNVPPRLTQLSFLSDVAAIYRGSSALMELLARLWVENAWKLEASFQQVKSDLIQGLSTAGGSLSRDSEKHLALLIPLVQDAPGMASEFLAGTEIIDALSASYTMVSPVHKKILKITYLSFKSLMEKKPPNFSLLVDHLYSLIDSISSQRKDSQHGSNTLLGDLISKTSLVLHIQERVEETNAARARPLLAKLQLIAPVMEPKRPRSVRSKANKGKQRAHTRQVDTAAEHSFMDDLQVHRMSLVTQVQELFPNLGAGFVMRALDEYGDNVERVTAHLLDDDLPAHLRDADRNEELGPHPSTGTSNPSPPSAPPFLLERRNVFDNDELDSLAVEASRLHIGRRHASQTAEDILDDRSTAPNKAAILSALAAFDSDDDERDDTYDTADVGGTVDSVAPGAPDEPNLAPNDERERTLYFAYSRSPELFARDAVTRRSPGRAELRSETGMTNEAIEGWGLMISRDQSALRRLQVKHTMFAGSQRELEPTAWRAGRSAPGDDSGDDGVENHHGEQSYRGGRGRGRGGGGGRGRGNGSSNVTGGPGNDKDTQISRQRKEAHKGSRANHNRRDQRARKMARGMGPV